MLICYSSKRKLKHKCITVHMVYVSKNLGDSNKGKSRKEEEGRLERKEKETELQG